MDSETILIKELEKEITTYENSIEVIQKSVDSSNSVAQKVIEIFNSLQNSCTQLEERITPIYTKTAILVTATKNIDTCLSEVDKIIDYNNVCVSGKYNNIRSILKPLNYNSNNNIDDVINYFEHLSEANRYFSIHSNFKYSEKLLHSIKDIFKKVNFECEQEFISTLSIIQKEFMHNYHTDIEYKQTTLSELVSESSIHKLSKLAECLETTNSFNTVKSLLKEHRRESMKAIMKIYPTSEDNNINNIYLHRYQKNSHPLITYTKKIINLLGMEKALTFEILCYSTSTVTIDEYETFFSETIEAPLSIYLNKVEEVTKTKMSNKLLILFDLLLLLHSLVPRFQEIISNDNKNNNTLIIRIKLLIEHLTLLAKKSLIEYHDYILTNSSKQLSHNGTIHIFTIENIAFIRSLYEYKQLIESEINFSISDDLNLNYNVPSIAGKIILYLVEALENNLKVKTKNYMEPSLSAIFLVNNYHYIRSHLYNIDQNINLLVGNYINIHYEQLIIDCQKQYTLHSFDKLLSFITTNNDEETSNDINLSTKEKNNIKHNFNEFNRIFFELYCTQRQYSIPDTTLRNKIRNDNISLLVPKYRIFLQRYSKVKFSKHPDKYIKYSSQAVEAMLNKLFDETL